MELRGYLERIHYNGSLQPSLQTLRELHKAHLLSVPFENLDIHSGRPIKLDQEHLYQKIVLEKRGGFCYELNGMFASLLRDLGFDVTILSARVHKGNGDFGPEYDHLTLLVNIEESWLADVGFGDSFREPLCMVDGIEQPQVFNTYRLRVEDKVWVYEVSADSGQWQPEYKFTLQPHMLSDFEVMCHYQETSPDSSFTKRIVCTLATADGRVTLRNDRLITTHQGYKEEIPIVSEADFADQLQRIFGMQH